MVSIPVNEVTVADMIEWDKLQKEIAHFKATVMASEMLLRRKIFAAYFPEPKEGTNNAQLADSWVLKGVYGLDRKIDVGALTALAPQFAEKGINLNALVEAEPKLRVAQYRELTAEQRALFDQCLIIKPSSPQLEIVLPKKAAK